ncbi:MULTISPECIES: DNA gyrase C-terminal beta-propeller domain-containing protein, partial [Vibrio]
EVGDLDSDEILAITNQGRMLLFPIKDLPQLAKGKGNKIINIPAAKAKEREEVLSHLIALPQGASLTLYAGKRKLGLKPADLENFRGERGRRGSLLPRGLQRVTRIDVELGESSSTEESSESE